MVNGMVWHGGCCLPAKTDEDGRARERSVSVHVSITQGFHITICLSPNRYTFHSFPSTEFSPLFLRVFSRILSPSKKLSTFEHFWHRKRVHWLMLLMLMLSVAVCEMGPWIYAFLFFSFLSVLLLLLLLLFHCFFFFVFTLSLDGIFVIDNR